MPDKPARPCRYPGCPILTRYPSGYCEGHDKAAKRQIDRQRGTASARGYDARWQKARTTYLAHHPLCVKCHAKDRVTAATTVDHVRPHRGDYDLFWDEGNWAALCSYHHNVKTATEDGAFGNYAKRTG